MDVSSTPEIMDRHSTSYSEVLAEGFCGANWLAANVCHYLQDSHNGCDIQPVCCVMNQAMIDWLTDWLFNVFIYSLENSL
jgi:hypothetical protein